MTFFALVATVNRESTLKARKTSRECKTNWNSRMTSLIFSVALNRRAKLCALYLQGSKSIIRKTTYTLNNVVF